MDDVECLLMIYGGNESLQHLMDAEIFDDDSNFAQHEETSSHRSRINVPCSFREVECEICSTSACDVMRQVSIELQKLARTENVSFDLIFHADNGTETHYLRCVSLSSNLLHELVAFNCSVTVNVFPG